MTSLEIRPMWTRRLAQRVVMRLDVDVTLPPGLVPAAGSNAVHRPDATGRRRSDASSSWAPHGRRGSPVPPLLAAGAAATQGRLQMWPRVDWLME